MKEGESGACKGTVLGVESAYKRILESEKNEPC